MEQLEQELFEFIKQAIQECKQKNIGKAGLANFLSKQGIYFGEVVVKAPKEDEIIEKSIYVKTHYFDEEEHKTYYFSIADLEQCSEKEAWDLIQSRKQ